jgi:N-acylneuraminate cytidylyltransferase
VLRSPKNSDDHATTSDVLEEVLAFYAEKDIHPEICCCIYPTTPLLNPDDLRSAFETFHHGQFDTVISAVRYDFPIQRAFQLGSNNSVMIEHPECMSMRSQDLPVHYHDAGAFYFFRTEQFLKTRDLWKGSIGAYLLPESRVQDIDTPQDWNLAEIKFKAL